MVFQTCLPENRIITAIYEENLDRINSGEWLVLLCDKLESDCLDLRRSLCRMLITTDNVGLALGDPSEDTTLRTRMSAFELITIYHVLDGEFRKLDSHQDVISLRNVIRRHLWIEIPPLKFWAHPTSKLTNFYIFFYKMKRMSYVFWWIAGLLTTGLLIINFFWRKIPWCNFKRGSNQKSLAPVPHSVSVILVDEDQDFSDVNHCNEEMNLHLKRNKC